MRPLNEVSVPKSDEHKRLWRWVAKLMWAAGTVSTLVELLVRRGPWAGSVGLSLLAVGTVFWLESQTVVARAAGQGRPPGAAAL